MSVSAEFKVANSLSFFKNLLCEGLLSDLDIYIFYY